MIVGQKRAVVIGVALFAAGCEASFEDLRPEQTDASILIVDAGFVDAGRPAVEMDGGSGAPGLDAGSEDRDSTGEVVLSAGAWTGRSDYRATGVAEIVRSPDGQSELRLSDDFSVSSVPGPVLVLSFRDRIGSSLDPGQGDVELGPFQRDLLSYAIPAGADDRLYAWIYCRPFRIEVARAALESVQ